MLKTDIPLVTIEKRAKLIY